MFRRSSVRYGTTPEATTPYQRAAQAWDDRIGSARVQAIAGGSPVSDRSRSRLSWLAG